MRKVIWTVRNCFIQILFSHKYLIWILIVTGCYSSVLSQRTMPFAEGWYTYYAQCINKGEIVYKDFDYLFTPLYISFISFVTKIFGYKIIILRMVGVCFFCMIAVIVYLILREMFRQPWACIAAVTSVFFLQSEVGQVFYDYIRLMDIFACLTVLFLIKAVKHGNAELNKKYNFFILSAGISNACFYLVKQNMGMVFAVYVCIFIIAANVVLHKNINYILKSLLLYLGGLAVPVLTVYAVMLWKGSFIPYMEQTGVAAIEAKGGVGPILFGWLKNNRESF